MNLTTFAQFGRRGRRLVWGGALTGLLLAAGTTAIGDVHPDAKRLANQRRESLSLFAGPTAVLRGNQLQCGLRNTGDTCANVFNSPTGGGGFWPTGSQNQYIFNTGLQIAGIMGADGGPWANDTVGAYFFDARGTQAHGTPLTDIFNSLNPEDLAAWPTEAFVGATDPTLFQDVLLDRAVASQQDSWVRYWDGDPAKNSARKHPMGITVTQRSLAWNYPAGNESLIYFIYNFANSTADAEFQRLNEAQFFSGNNELPDAGITIGEIFAAFSTDMDVTSDAGENFSTAVLPFDLGISYHGGFSASEFSYPPDLFFPPFFTDAPGLIGVKYLRSPIVPGSNPPRQVGLTLFSVTLNSNTGFPDPEGDKQLWRYLSGKVNPAAGDFPCTVSAEIVNPDPALVQRSMCFLSQTAADTRFFQASGPFAMAPGANSTIVVAYIAAPTVATLPDGSASGIIANAASTSANPPGVASFHPGFVSARACSDPNNVPASCAEVDNTNAIKALERGAGWIQYTGPPPASALESPANKLDQDSVTVVPGSLLGRAIVAQSIFDSKFLLGFAPAQPTFYLVPGDNQVTVVWDPSVTEDTTLANGGDPFFTVAGDTASALFNPNYRQFDVEGYRVWRGTSSGSLDLIAQFDYANTTFTDVTCETVPPTEDVGALAIDDVTGDTVPAGAGFAAGEICPVGFSSTVDVSNDLVFNNGEAGALAGAGVFRLSNGQAAYDGEPIVAVASDEAGEGLALSNSGVPFVFVDDDVTNNFTYFYAVGAFDVNSPASVTHSLRSARVAQSTSPRAGAPNVQAAELQVAMLDADGNEVVAGFAPDIDPEDGTFSGPFPPTDGITLGFAPLVPRLLPTFSIVATIDSLQPAMTVGCPGGDAGFGACWQLFVTVNTDGNVTQKVVSGFTPMWDAFGRRNAATEFRVIEAVVPFDQGALDAFGIPSGAGNATADFIFEQSMNTSAQETQANLREGSFGISSRVRHGGSRWFSGANETVPDPAMWTRVGELDGVEKVFKPIGFTLQSAGGAALGGSSCMRSWTAFGGMAAMARSADIQFTWTGGSVDVQDVTHHVPVPFSTLPKSSWGFLTEDANGNGAIDWADFHFLANISPFIAGDGLCGHVDDPGTYVELSSAPPTLGPVYTGPADPTLGPVTPTGQGFGLYVNGERYIFQLADAPADGTVWTLRSYSGRVRVSSATVDTDDPGGYSYRPNQDSSSDGIRPPAIPGITLSFGVEAATNFGGRVDLTQVHTVPDPFLGSSLFDRAPTSKQLMFVNLPQQATLRIYTLTGILVDVLVHDDLTGGGREVWDLRNRNDQFVASGVYFFHVLTPSGESHVGKFTVVQQAGVN